MKKYRFYKDEDGWFIDIPGYPFAKANLAMVMGADVLLDQLSNNGTEITLSFHNKEFENYDGLLNRVKKNNFGIGGAIYSGEKIIINNKLEEDNQLYLCPVTIYVFGHYPKKIYYKID